MNTQYDFISVGEALLDFISDDLGGSLAAARVFQRHAGGQASNLAVTMSRLGQKAAAAVAVGDDGLGEHFIHSLVDAGVDTQFIQVSQTLPTTVVIVSRQTITPEFIIYRGADSAIYPQEALLEAVKRTRILHTSAFALARNPARDTILQCMQLAKEHGALVTLDPNYHPRIWPDTENFKAVLQDAFALVDVTKPSIEDCERFIGPGLTPVAYAEAFSELGPSTVLVSMGNQGVVLASKDGTRYHLYPQAVDVVDVTGAGDAFWSGFLTARLNGKSDLESACFGQAVAEEKIKFVGPIRSMPAVNLLNQHAARIRSAAHKIQS